MNKKIVESNLSRAVDALTKCNIAKDGEISSTFRGQISSFGAAVSMGSFKAAVAFFAEDAKNGDSGISRSDLIRAIDYIVNENRSEPRSADEICQEILREKDSSKITALCEKFIDASIALKLAMNSFKLVKK